LPACRFGEIAEKNMKLNFELVAGPYKGATGGLAWDGSALYFTAVAEDRLLRYDPKKDTVEDYRRWTYRANGLAIGPNGELYGGQEGGRRVVQYLPEGITTPTALQLDGRYHNFPCDLVVDRKGRVWFSDPYNPVPAFGPQMYPLLDHQSVLRMQSDRGWTLSRMTYDTVGPRALALSPDEATLYVADGDAGAKLRELRAYPIEADGTLARPRLLHTFGSDYRGAHRGIEGMCVDSEGNILACAGWNKAGPGPLLYVFSPAGAVLETHTLPADLPMRIAFGDAKLDSLYLTAGDGGLYRAKNTGLRGAARFAKTA
jgi:gluconolactonase